MLPSTLSLFVSYIWLLYKPTNINRFSLEVELFSKIKHVLSRLKFPWSWNTFDEYLPCEQVDKYLYLIVMWKLTAFISEISMACGLSKFVLYGIRILAQPCLAVFQTWSWRHIQQSLSTLLICRNSSSLYRTMRVSNSLLVTNHTSVVLLAQTSQSVKQQTVSSSFFFFFF